MLLQLFRSSRAAGRAVPAAGFQWALLLLLVFAHGSAQWHLLAEQHHVCPVHGEVVDGRSPESDHGPGDHATALGTHHAPVADHHCDIAAQLLRSARPETPAAVVVTDRTGAAAPALAPADAAPQRAVLSFAPKHSPPTL